MNIKLQKIADAAAGIKSDIPEKRRLYEQGILEARAAQGRAQEAKENAKTERELDKALDDGARAKEKERFFERQLEKVRFTPLMDEDTYNDLVQSAADAVEDAAANFYSVAVKALQALVKARHEAEAVARDADKVLTSLDLASNVLQSKYRYRRITLQDEPDLLYEDAGEWTLHTTRFSSDIYSMSTHDDDDKISVALHRLWSAVGEIN